MGRYFGGASVIPQSPNRCWNRIHAGLLRRTGMLRPSNPHSKNQQRRASSITASLTPGVRRCQLATSSRSATQSRHSSDRPWVHLSQSKSGKQVASNETRVQFPPPPPEGTCENSQVPFFIEYTSFHSRRETRVSNPRPLSISNCGHQS
jgi:hypothetical protein